MKSQQFSILKAGVYTFCGILAAYVAITIFGGESQSDALRELLTFANPVITALLIQGQLTPINRTVEQVRDQTNGQLTAKLSELKQTIQDNGNKG